MPDVGKVTNAWMAYCSFTLGFFSCSLGFSSSITLTLVTPFSFSLGTDESNCPFCSIVVPVSYAFFSIMEIFTNVTTLVDLSTIFWIEGCT